MSESSPGRLRRWVRHACMAGVLAGVTVIVVSLTGMIVAESNTAMPWLWSGLIVMMASLLTLVLASGTGYPGAAAVRGSGIVVVSVTGAAWMLIALEVLKPWRYSDPPGYISVLAFGTYASVMVAMVHYLLGLTAPPAWYNVLRRCVVGLAVGMVCVAGGLFTMYALEIGAAMVTFPAEAALTVGTLLTVLGLLITRTVHGHLQQAPPAEDQRALSRETELTFQCPKCGASQSHRPGPVRKCVSCRAKMTIELHEPRCECGYLIYRLQTSTCPECGKDLSAYQSRGTADAGSGAAFSGADDQVVSAEAGDRREPGDDHHAA